MPKTSRKRKPRSLTEMRERANIAEGARVVCFEHTIDGMRSELGVFVTNVQQSCYTKDSWAHNKGLEVLDEVVEVLSKYDAEFRAKYATHKDGWGPGHPQWESWAHIRQARMPCPRPQEYESEEFFQLDLYGQRRIKFFMDIVEKVRPFIEVWQQQRIVEVIQEGEVDRSKFTVVLDTLREAIEALQDVWKEPKGPTAPENDEVYLQLCRTTRKGLALVPWLPDAAWGTRKRSASINDVDDETVHAVGLRSRKRVRFNTIEGSLEDVNFVPGEGALISTLISDTHVAEEGLPIRTRDTRPSSSAQRRSTPEAPSSPTSTATASPPLTESSLDNTLPSSAHMASRSSEHLAGNNTITAQTTPSRSPRPCVSVTSEFDIFERFRTWAQHRIPPLTQPDSGGVGAQSE